MHMKAYMYAKIIFYPTTANQKAGNDTDMLCMYIFSSLPS